MLDREELRRRLARVDALPPAARARVRGDHDLNPDVVPPSVLTAAGVLVPVIDRPDGLTVLFTRRTAHLAAHAGQISFPGGRVEPADRDALAAALRETEEEVGLPPDRVEVLGRLDTYVIRSGFEVQPFVGWVRPPVILRADPHEVAEIFEVPLDWLLAPGRPERRRRTLQGRERWTWTFGYHDYDIWGATAGMLVNLREALGVT